MYAWIWRRLPFGLPGKIIGSLLLTAVAVSLLWYLVFPAAEPLLPFDDVNVSEDGGDPGQVPGDPGVAPTESLPPDGEIPYDTDQNQPPPSPSRR
jgi:hypothetical protein